MASKGRSATIVLGLLLSLSVAVLGSAFTPSKQKSLISSSPKSSLVTSQAPYTKLSEKSEDTVGGEGKSTPGASLRGGANSAILPAVVPPLPTLQDFQKFALPCLALWVSGPLLSLVDTSFVGLSGPSAESAKQLAALGPATTFFDGATYLFAFLNVATTNLYSSARARGGAHSEEAEGAVRTATRVARNCGIGLTIFLFACARPLLKLYIGKTKRKYRLNLELI